MSNSDLARASIEMLRRFIDRNSPGEHCSFPEDRVEYKELNEALNAIADRLTTCDALEELKARDGKPTPHWFSDRAAKRDSE